MKAIPLLNTNEFALVDDEDYNLVISSARDHWVLLESNKTQYARTGQWRNGTNLLMHHLILPPKEGFEIDHKDHCGLHNWRANLRYLTHSLNSLNRVTHSVRKTPSGKWAARITVNYKYKHIGTFPTKEQAEHACLKEKETLLTNQSGTSQLQLNTNHIPNVNLSCF